MSTVPSSKIFQLQICITLAIQTQNAVYSTLAEASLKLS